MISQSVCCLLVFPSQYLRAFSRRSPRSSTFATLISVTVFILLLRSAHSSAEKRNALHERTELCGGNPSMPSRTFSNKDPCDTSKCKFGGRCWMERTRSNSTRHTKYNTDKFVVTCHCTDHCANHPVIPGSEPELSNVCGSDGKTYLTECHMKLASCRCQFPITRRWRGSCEKGPISPSVRLPPAGAVNREEIEEGSGSGDSEMCGEHVTCRFGAVCDVDAEDGPCLCKHDCPGTVPNTVCGSDGRTYYNECYMKDTACQYQQEIEVAHVGPCPNDRGSTPPAPEGSGDDANDFDYEASGSLPLKEHRSNAEKTKKDPCVGILCLHGVCVPVGDNDFECSCEAVCDRQLLIVQQNSLAHFEERTRQRLAMVFPHVESRYHDDELRQLRHREESQPTAAARTPQSTIRRVSRLRKPSSNVDIDHIVVPMEDDADLKQAEVLWTQKRRRGRGNSEWRLSQKQRRGRKSNGGIRRYKRSALFTVPVALGTTLINETVCGTDGKTYKDECQMRVHACYDKKKIQVNKKGDCPYYYKKKPTFAETNHAPPSIYSSEEGFASLSFSDSNNQKGNNLPSSDSWQSTRGREMSPSLPASPAQLQQNEDASLSPRTLAQSQINEQKTSSESSTTTKSNENFENVKTSFAVSLEVSDAILPDPSGNHATTDKQMTPALPDPNRGYVPQHTVRKIWVIILAGFLQLVLLTLVASFVWRKVKRSSAERNHKPEDAKATSLNVESGESERLQATV